MAIATPFCRDHEKHEWIHHPLLEAAIDYMGVPDELSVQISIYSEAPAGCSTGTSAAVTVALIGALDQLTPGRLHPARGGLCGPPHRDRYASPAERHPGPAVRGLWRDQLYRDVRVSLRRRVADPGAQPDVVGAGAAAVPDLPGQVAQLVGGARDGDSQHPLEDAGPEYPELETLRSLRQASRDAVYAGDFAALGQAMARNTEAQRALHSALVSAEAEQIIEAGPRAHGALGWKVNGAGGEGGSITLLCGPSMSAKRAMIREIEETNPLYQNIPLYLSRYGLRVWKRRWRIDRPVA